jgi:cyclopropane fatty-acyl-phospholipid synthase-like methyltransferase
VTWADFYRPRVNNESSLSKFRAKYNAFFDLIAEKKPKRLAELGCGIASCAKILHEKRVGKEHFLVDSSVEMLCLARRNLRDTGITARYICADARVRRAPKEADLVYSLGLLEHFTNEGIAYVIHTHAKPGRPMLHLVPSDRYHTPSFGDERLLSAEEWLAIAGPDEIIEMNDGHELVLVWG